MQAPTCVQMRIRTPGDAHIVFHAVSLGLRPMVSRRLDTDERRYIQSGCVFVWEERGPNAESSGIGIERWTDSIRWGPSRVRDEFLFYNEREITPNDGDPAAESLATSSLRSQARTQNRGSLVKQTYSVFVETRGGRRKWHLIAYYTPETLNYLHIVDDFPELARITVPPGKYRTARTGTRGSGRTNSQGDQYQIVNMYPPHPYPVQYGHTNPQQLGSLHTQSKSASSPDKTDLLAPLEYLKAIPPPRRHPLDEEALMSFAKKQPGWVY